MSILNNAEGARWLWTYDDGHDTHEVYTDVNTEPTFEQLRRKYGSITRNWQLCNSCCIEEEVLELLNKGDNYENGN